MRRKITVYGLRFSKTTFWNRLNTGFLEPAVATALTACGIETLFIVFSSLNKQYKLLQQHLPLAVLKRQQFGSTALNTRVATALTACGIETDQRLA